MQNNRFKKIYFTLFLSIVSQAAIFAETNDNHNQLDRSLQRSDSIPIQNVEMLSDHYLEGYIQALLDAHYYEFKVLATVHHGEVVLSNLPNNDLIAKSICAFVQDMPNIKSVKIEQSHFDTENILKKGCHIDPKVEGVWFPQSTVLFLPLIADPRQPINSVNLRANDHISGKKAIAVSLGDDFPIFRWKNIGKFHGAMQLGVEAGIWAVFNFEDVPVNENGDVCRMLNTDYFVGFPLTYAFDSWSFRLRPYHISSHLGDEYIVDHPETVHSRRNPSFEAVDLITSYQFTSGLRLYAGPGFIGHSDNSFKLKPLYFEYGLEWRFPGKKLTYHRLYGSPFLAAHLSHWQHHHWQADTTIRLGYELSKLQGVGRKMRIYFDGHKGYSREGEFFNRKANYVELGTSWGF
ncbi:MAG: DUF1207 domain-containing protein [Rhabdochlamydiaceae bacterium]